MVKSSEHYVAYEYEWMGGIIFDDLTILTTSGITTIFAIAIISLLFIQFLSLNLCWHIVVTGPIGD